MSDLADMSRNGRGGTSFNDVIDGLIGETVSVFVDDTTFSGRLACVESSFITVATRGSGSTPSLVYVPKRKIEAVRI